MAFITMTYAEWTAEATRRFGEHKRAWAFVCPSCGYVATVGDWMDAGASEGEVAFSCVGRRTENPKQIGERPGLCNYAGGGLFRLNPVKVIMPDGVEHNIFAFAPTEECNADGSER